VKFQKILVQCDVGCGNRFLYICTLKILKTSSHIKCFTVTLQLQVEPPLQRKYTKHKTKEKQERTCNIRIKKIKSVKLENLKAANIHAHFWRMGPVVSEYTLS
jgi:hypothetical protein